MVDNKDVFDTIKSNGETFTVIYPLHDKLINQLQVYIV